MMQKSMEQKREEYEESLLNNEEYNFNTVNRGLELLLRRNKKRQEEPNTFQLKFGKLISLFGREIDVFLNFHINFKKIHSRRS